MNVTISDIRTVLGCLNAVRKFLTNRPLALSVHQYLLTLLKVSYCIICQLLKWSLR